MTFTELIFGPHGPQMFIAMMGFLLVGALLRKSIRLKQRKPHSASSPRRFCFHYWWKDNRADMTIGFLIAFIFVRFPALYIEPVIAASLPTIDPHEGLLAGSILIGFGIDYLSERLATIANLKA
jgi:hypothetical protein